MNGRTAIMGLVMCAVALCATFEYGRAEPGTSAATSGIGVVSFRKVLAQSKKQAQWQMSMGAEQGKARSVLESLSRELAAEEAELKTLKPGTADHLKQLQSSIEKRGTLKSRQEYLEEELKLKEKNWLEGVYQEVLKIVAGLAREKDLDLVLERTEPDFPISSEELVMTLNTHKALYSGGCVDLTEEVLSRFDASENVKP